MIDYQIVRSAVRRTIAIYVKDCSVIVRAPKRISKEFIDGYVQSKREWIEKNLQKQRELEEARRQFQLTELFFLGEKYPVVLHKDKMARFTGKKFFVPAGDIEMQRQAVSDWMKKEIKPIIEKRVEHFSAQMGVNVSSIRISNAKTRWGSCSQKGNLNFSWKLAFARGELIDYVVIHELAHRKEMNHSDAFWGIVRQYVPYPEKCRKELQSLQKTLLEQGWENS